jgi:hypothetical protein
VKKITQSALKFLFGGGDSDDSFHHENPDVHQVFLVCTCHDFILAIMTKITLLRSLLIYLSLSMAAQPVHQIVGHWIAEGPGNTKVFVDFTKNGTFKVYSKEGTENQGSYRTGLDTLLLYDNKCGMKMPGKYLLNFYGEDSVSFFLLQDSCTDRAQEVNGGRMKRG